VSPGPDKPALAVHACGIASVVNINDALALFQEIGNRFRREVDRFAASAGVPVRHLESPAGPAGMTASWTTSARIWTGLPASSMSGWWPSSSPRSSSG
jgi:hypothetical protein